MKLFDRCNRGYTAATLALFISLAACDGGDTTSPTPVPTPQPNDPFPPPEAEPDGPQILSLSLNSPTLSDVDQAVVTAIVTDPQGIEDLIGGELSLPGGAVLGAFATAAQEGAYSISLRWADLRPVVDITSEEGSVSVALTARFFDQSGHQASQSVSLELACANSDKVPCDAQCFNIYDTSQSSSRYNCGACGNDCGDVAADVSNQAPGDVYSYSCFGPDLAFETPVQCQVELRVWASEFSICTQACQDKGLPGCRGAVARFTSGSFLNVMCNDTTRLSTGEPHSVNLNELLYLNCLCTQKI